MSTVTTEEASKRTKSNNKKTPTSMFLDKNLWFRVRRAALDMGITTTKFVENALKEELARVYRKEKE